MKTNKIFSRVLIFLYLCIPYLPLFGEIDRIASQWAIISFLNFISIMFIFFRFGIKSFMITSQKPIIFYSLFLIVCIISMIKSINLTESSVEFFRYFSVLLTLIVIPNLLLKSRSIEFLMICLFIFSLFDIMGIFLQNSQGLPLIGFTGNKNIASASLIIKSNFVLYLLYRYNNFYIKILSFIILFFSFSAVLMIGSKAGVLTSIIITSLLFIFSFFKKPFLYSNYILIFAFVAATLFSSSQNDKFKDAISDTVNYTNDSGSTDRIKYYTQALKTFGENPFLGIGFGNWKIYSSKYDSIDMKEYIVQYHTHNDYIQILAETGIFGAALYLMFFASIFLILIRYLMKFYKQNSIKNFQIFIICLLCIIVYFIDANLNFPAARVVMQLNLVSIIALILTVIIDENEFSKIK